MPADEAIAPVWVGEWLVEPALDSISRAGETQKLEPRTMRLLLCLLDSPGSVVLRVAKSLVGFKRDEICPHLIGGRFDVLSRSAPKSNLLSRLFGRQ